MEIIESAAQAIQNAESLLFTAGAGIGVDSGLPDFRGNEGFWQAYPPFAKLGLSFVDLANPRWFERDPQLAWGFYGHRLNLYRATTPHAGFAILKGWSEQKPARVYTSNVDGQFQIAGLNEVCEVHGSILHAQCTKPCCDEIWSLENTEILVDETSFRAEEPLPRCPHCGAMARPNILMFGDAKWVLGRSLKQEQALMSWLATLDLTRLTIVEIGAGTALPTVRHFSEHFQKRGATLIRINVRESDGPRGTLSLSLGGRDALNRLNAAQ
jgi:NAD-dependent SIR2 family protein deacetylase